MRINIERSRILSNGLPMHGAFLNDVTVKDEMPLRCFRHYPAIHSAASIDQLSQRSVFEDVTAFRHVDRQLGLIVLAWGGV